MMSAFFSAVSGLKSQQTGLNVIANNISNVNTTGFKQQRVSFSDVLSQTLSGATGASGNKGGTNAIQLGLGVGVSSTDTIMTTGSTQSTGVDTDCSISGSGFFIVSGGSSGQYQFTRAGNFSVDEGGNLTVNGYKVCGWQDYDVDAASGDYVYNTSKAVEAINLYSDSYNGNKKVIAAKATTGLTLSGNLDTSATASGTALQTIGAVTTYDSTTTVDNIYDALGNEHSIKINWKKCYVDTATNTTSWYYSITSDDLTVSPASGYVAFDSSGQMVSTVTSGATTYTFDTDPTLTLTPAASLGTAAFTVDMDLNNILQNTTTTTAAVTGTADDGYAAGELQGISISSDGTIIGTYSNSQTQPLGMIALAVFTNPEGLEKIGASLYAVTANSGNFTGGVVAGSGGSGALSTGTLEMSNVDLAQQFSEMMISQRAYQANSKVISTADEMLQSVIQMV
ncbi:MAG: flagellar hook protein FlgE [Sporomusaceae bacterium]|nr:flagellar hook protein FlgE [Sporomusaceae bacterium]